MKSLIISVQNPVSGLGFKGNCNSWTIPKEDGRRQARRSLGIRPDGGSWREWQRAILTMPDRSLIHSGVTRSTRAKVCTQQEKEKRKMNLGVKARMRKMGVRKRVKVRDGPPVLKAPTDDRLYQVIHLQNGLTALLIHDPLMVDNVGERTEEIDSGSEDTSNEDDEDVENDNQDGDPTDGTSSECGHHHVSLSASEEEPEGDDEEIYADEGGRTRRSPAIAPTKKAAAAMCVGVGSFSDPGDAQGLAHFLEHMLFMGSRKFPDENEYDFFLSKHGGGSNAFTDTEYTCYHFDVNHKYLKGALDRFSQIFISPLAKADAMDREVQAIDSEFDQVLQSDTCRLLQLQCHTADAKHPFHTFSWGNRKSLGLPMENGVDMRGKMLELYKKYYLAGRMKLTVLGGEPLETLKDWVTELFGDVRGGKQDRLVFPWSGPIWEKGLFHKVESVKDQHFLSMMWPLPCLESEYLKKPQDYISHLVGHEGAGSLLSLLKEKGWATGLSAGVGEGGYERSTAGYMFSVNIYLTALGLENVLGVVDLFYQYAKMLRDIGPQKWVFQELQAMGMMEFKFAEEESAENYVVRLASNMHLYKEEHIIYGDYSFEEWDAKLVSDLLSVITPDNMRLDILTKDFDRGSPGVQFEPWFDVPYLVEILPKDVLQIWANPPRVDPALHMPVVNEFMPLDFGIRSSKPGATNGEAPRILHHDAAVKVWYMLDRTFKTPRANAFVSISVPAACKSVKATVLTEIYVKLLIDALNETLYLANVAKLESSISSFGSRLSLKTFGFNEKLPLLAQKIADLCKTFSPRSDRFQAMKEDLERVYRNINMKPLKHSAYLRLQVLKERFWTVDEKLECLLSLSVQDVVDFIPQLFEQTFMEAICHGNLSEEEVHNIIRIFKEAFVFSDLPPDMRPKDLVYQLPLTPHVLSADVKNDSEDNSVVETYFQVGQDLGQTSIRLRAILDLMEEIIYEPCFNQLRTKEQLGYRVDSGVLVIHRILGFYFRVQSSKYSPPFLQSRIDNFIGTILDILNKMGDEEFTSYKESLIAEKMERDPSLIDETDRHWEQIWEQRYLFDARKLEAMEVRTIEKSDVIEWFSTYFPSGAPNQRKLSIHVWGSNMPKDDSMSEKITAESYTTITDLPSFKDNMILYPALN